MAWKNNTIIHIPQAIVNLSDHWICHQKLLSVHDPRDPLALPVTNFSSIPSVTANYDWPLPLEVSYRV